jgi:hypothetical protein
MMESYEEWLEKNDKDHLYEDYVSEQMPERSGCSTLLYICIILFTFVMLHYCK